MGDDDDVELSDYVEDEIGVSLGSNSSIDSAFEDGRKREESYHRHHFSHYKNNSDDGSSFEDGLIGNQQDKGGLPSGSGRGDRERDRDREGELLEEPDELLQSTLGNEFLQLFAPSNQPDTTANSSITTSSSNLPTTTTPLTSLAHTKEGTQPSPSPFSPGDEKGETERERERERERELERVKTTGTKIDRRSFGPSPSSSSDRSFSSPPPSSPSSVASSAASSSARSPGS